MSDQRFERAIRAFDALNAEDPVREFDRGVERPRLLLQAERLARWVERLDPEASEPLRLAAHCQHLERWKIPRSDFPEGRIGYLSWRTSLGKFHAERARAVLRDAGYDDDTLEAVERIVRKQHLTLNPDAQTMEDALCLVFLEFEIGAFLEKYPDQDKATAILQKTWRKMSERGRSAALSLPLEPRAQKLVARALAAPAPEA